MADHRKARAERNAVKNKPYNIYVSQCCNAPATKPPLVTPKVDPSKKVNGLPPADDCGSLGTWRCSACRKHCKVTPHRNKEEQ